MATNKHLKAFALRVNTVTREHILWSAEFRIRWYSCTHAL